MPANTIFYGWRQAALALCLLAAAGCGKPASPSGPPPPSVTVARPVARKIVEHSECTGRLAAIQNVSVRPRVSGYITQIPFKEGTIVKKDDLLFVIDPRPYQAAFDQAVGQLKQAQAQKELNDRNFVRAQSLQANKVTSKEEFDQAATAQNQSNAQVASAQAAVEAARLNLDFTRITAAIDGRVSRVLVTIGNLVGNDTTRAHEQPPGLRLSRVRAWYRWARHGSTLCPRRHPFSAHSSKRG
jgi:multidrug efflux pump subunit AcrA (membrane-fusion protein)